MKEEDLTHNTMLLLASLITAYEKGDRAVIRSDKDRTSEVAGSLYEIMNDAYRDKMNDS